MTDTNSIVLDSFALLGYLENETFSERVEKLLKRARQGKIRAYLHAIHLGEVYYITLREQGQDLADLLELGRNIHRRSYTNGLPA